MARVSKLRSNARVTEGCDLQSGLTSRRFCEKETMAVRFQPVFSMTLYVKKERKKKNTSAVRSGKFQKPSSKQPFAKLVKEQTTDVRTVQHATGQDNPF